ncbi:MAG TPA: iron-containing alcohol dehydrogenase [Rhodospirillales bacterium]|nr:iron-containing alcohol dehydrogenase [Rhodospirillales bacterium]
MPSSVLAAIAPFAIARLPRLVFGEGALADLPKQAGAFGRHALLVTGARSFRAGAHWPALLDGLGAAGIAVDDMTVDGEPSPELVDAAVESFADRGIDMVIGIGGGSALDAAKAIAGLLPHRRSVMRHLEGVGPEEPYRGPSLPLILAPTTAGTGSEATKNAVLSRHGPAGFKKSFRDEQLVARVAIVDPALLASCPPAVIAANGMDAFTQLFESFVSIKANPFTDALCWSGIEAFAAGFFAAYAGGEGDAARAGRTQMAYAALLSGICLAQTGLGSVHGLASPLGAQFPIPHGVCCGTLVADATRINLRALRARLPASPALAKYARVGGLLAGEGSNADAAHRLVDRLADWTERLALPRLSAYGMGEADLPAVIADSRGSSMKTNPLVLTDGEIEELLRARL